MGKLLKTRFKFYKYGDECKTLLKWAEDERCIVNYNCLRKRIKNGWKFWDAITTPYFEVELRKKKDNNKDDGND